jgi:hypothetical protein
MKARILTNWESLTPLILPGSRIDTDRITFPAQS